MVWCFYLYEPIFICIITHTYQQNIQLKFDRKRDNCTYVVEIIGDLTHRWEVRYVSYPTYTRTLSQFLPFSIWPRCDLRSTLTSSDLRLTRPASLLFGATCFSSRLGRDGVRDKRLYTGCYCWGSGRHFALDVSHIVGPLNYSRCDTKHRLPCTITPFY